MSNKRRSRQTRRYATARRIQPAAGPPAAGKRAAWRKVGSRRRRSSTWPWALVLAVVITGGAALVAASSGSSSSSSGGGSTGPLLASVASFDNAAPGQTVDGIQCENAQQLRFHIHAHLAVFVNGQQRTIPLGIGIAPPRQTQAGATGDYVVAGSCFYWLHAHTSDGIIHIESPVQRTYTLGEYFDIWHQPLSPTQVGPAQGPVIVYVDGKRVSTSPRDVQLGSHTRVQLDVGKDVPPASYTFPLGL